MANTTDIQNAIRRTLLQSIWVHEWDVDNPRRSERRLSGNNYPANVATIMPPSQFAVTRQGQGADLALVANVMFPMFVQYRFNRSKYPTVHSVPFIQLQALYGFITARFASLTGDDIINIQIPPRTTPITLSASEGLGDNSDLTNYQGDWLVNLYIDVLVSFYTTRKDYNPDLWSTIQPGTFPSPDDDIEPEDDQPFTPNEINIGVNRARIEYDIDDPSTYAFDSNITLRNSSDDL